MDLSERYFLPAESLACADSPRDDPGDAAGTFTRAELAVLRWISTGKTNKEIAGILCRSEFTIKTHVQRMLLKTGLDNRIQLCALAHQGGLVKW